MLRSLALLLALPGLAFACAGGQTGGEMEEGGNTGLGWSCDERAEPIIDLQAPTKLGFAPADLLAFAAGTHSAPLTWHEAQAFTFDGARPVGVAPESGTSEITLELSHTSGQARYVHSNPKSAAEGDGREEATPLVASNCHDGVEIDVDVTITTAGGALSEQLAGTLKAKTGFFAELHVPLDLDALTGSLELSLPPDVENPVVGISAQFGPEGFFSGSIGGSIGGSLQQERDGTVALQSPTPLDLASWGENPCAYGGIPVALGASVAGFSPQALLDTVNDAEPSTLTWFDGTQTSLSIGVRTEQTFACLYLQGETQQLSLEGTLNATTADQRLNTELGVDVFGALDVNGALQSVEVVFNFNSYFSEAVPSADFEQVYGVHGIDVTDYSSVTFSFHSKYSPPFQRASNGSLKVLGLTPPPDCPPAPQPVSGPSPGCGGIESTPLATATW